MGLLHIILLIINLMQEHMLSWVITVTSREGCLNTQTTSFHDTKINLISRDYKVQVDARSTQAIDFEDYHPSSA